MAVLLDLPNELLAQITSDVAHPADNDGTDASTSRTNDLRNLALVSRLFRLFAQRHLFASVRLSTGSVANFLGTRVGGVPVRGLVRSLSLVARGEGVKQVRMSRDEAREAITACLRIEKLRVEGCERVHLWWLTGHRYLKSISLRELTLPIQAVSVPVFRQVETFDLSYIRVRDTDLPLVLSPAHFPALKTLYLGIVYVSPTGTKDDWPTSLLSLLPPEFLSIQLRRSAR